MPVITLFHSPRTRSTRFLFLLEELEAPYQVRLVTTRRADGTGAVDPANPHPHGKEFSAADVLYGTTFAMFAQSPMMPKSAVVEDYVKRIIARPAFARAQALDDGATAPSAAG
jgi:glutathione S-transferase